jgi:dihydroorotate dehydrogenase (fumarate)
MTMDTTSTYLGLKLANPIVCGACPMTSDMDAVRRLEDAGCAAIVLPSLFEEEILSELRNQQEIEAVGESFAEAMSYLPDPEGYHVGPDRYLEMVRNSKEALSIPVIGSLNGTTPGGWVDYAKGIEQAGADALELNVYFLASSPNETAAQMEARSLDVIRAVKGAVGIPLAVKLSPFFSSLVNFSAAAVEAGADGLVLFNRFYQPDIDIEALEVVPNLRLSSSEELRLRLRWLAMLSGRVDVSLAATGGVHNAVDVVKAVMAGAHSVQMVSALLIHGPEHIARTLEAMTFWMEQHEYTSLRQMQGSMSFVNTPNPSALARANYMKVLSSWER